VPCAKGRACDLRIGHADTIAYYGTLPSDDLISSDHRSRRRVIASDSPAAEDGLRVISGTLPALHCANDSQQTVEMGHERSNESCLASASRPILGISPAASRASNAGILSDLSPSSGPAAPGMTIKSAMSKSG